MNKFDILKKIQNGEITAEEGMDLLNQWEANGTVREDEATQSNDDGNKTKDGISNGDLTIKLDSTKLILETADVDEINVFITDENGELTTCPDSISIKETSEGINITEEMVMQKEFNLFGKEYIVEWINGANGKSFYYGDKNDPKRTKHEKKYGTYDNYTQDNSKNKHLTIKIQIPYTMQPDCIKASTGKSRIEARGLSSEKINLSTTSGAIYAEDINCYNLKSNVTSGNFKGQNIHASTFSFNSVSGDFTISGTIKKMTGNSVSGDVHLENQSRLKDSRISTISGNVSIAVPESQNQDYSFISVSGRGDLPHETRKVNRANYSSGNGTNIGIQTVSGNAKIVEQ